MASWACPICGEEADADESDPHGHFDTGDPNDDATNEYFRTLCHYVVRWRDDEEPIVACGATDFDGGGSSAKSDVTCQNCLSLM